MRQAGTLSNRDHAQRLADYLLTLGISTRVEPDGERWALWVRDEDQLAQATAALAEFQADPENPRYRLADREAATVRRQQAQSDAERRRNLIEVRDRWQTPAGRRAPLTMVLIAASVLVSLGTNFGKSNHELLGKLWFYPVFESPMRLFGVFVVDTPRYEVWRLVTPIVIHLSMLHLLFNMYWLYLLGSMIEIRRGTLRFGLLVLVVAVASNYGEYYFSTLFGRPALLAMMFGGMSGVLYGLFGYIWVKSRFEPQLGLFIDQGTTFVMILWLGVCWLGVVGSIANWAHTVGLVVGAAIGYAPRAWRQFKAIIDTAK